MFLTNFPFLKSAEESTTKSISKPRKVPHSHGLNALFSTPRPSMCNTKSTKGSSQAMDIFAVILRDSSHGRGRLFGTLLGSRDIEGFQTWAFEILVTPFFSCKHFWHQISSGFYRHQLSSDFSSIKPCHRYQVGRLP